MRSFAGPTVIRSWGSPLSGNGIWTMVMALSSDIGCSFREGDRAGLTGPRDAIRPWYQDRREGSVDRIYWKACRLRDMTRKGIAMPTSSDSSRTALPDDFTPATEEELAAATVGELRPLTGPVEIVDYDH